MKKDINNIHDKSYKTLFSNKDIFLNLINDFTEEQWKKELTSDNLTLVNKSFILADYEEVEADIVYQAEIEGQKVISSAIFLLDQKVGYEEYMNRLATIVKAFNKLTTEEKLELKNWLANTLSEEIKDVALVF